MYLTPTGQFFLARGVQLLEGLCVTSLGGAARPSLSILVDVLSRGQSFVG
ncbi:hypothetical protein LINPERPRIM_LOCUS40435 [Linum perenne]